MATNDAKILGYGGAASIVTNSTDVQVLITSGNIDVGVAPSLYTALDVPPPAEGLPGGADSRSRMEFADGTKQVSGSISFDLTEDLLALFTTTLLLKRAYHFNVGIFDGEAGQTLRYDLGDKKGGCFLTSLSLSGAPGGLISGSIAFVSDEEPEDWTRATYPYSRDFIRNSYDDATEYQYKPYAYWWSGNVDVREWTFTFNQAVEPVYSNEDVLLPRYLRVGLIDCSLEVTTYNQVRPHTGVVVATEFFNIVGVTTAQGYNYNGQTDLGMYRHSFESAARLSVGSGDPVLTVTTI